MAQAGFVLRYEGVEPGLAPKRVFNRVKRKAYRAAGSLWFEEFRPKHFTAAGAKEYGYTPRRGEELGLSRKEFFRSYTGRKVRMLGHRRPLMFSGESERLSRIRDVRATANGARIVIHARKLNFRPKGGRINMRDEMTRVSMREEVQLSRRFDGEMEVNLARVRESRVVKIKG